MDYRHIPAFCINLDARPDRWARAQAEFARLDWPVTRWSATRHEKSPYRALPPGHAGCFDSHRQLWRHGLAQQFPLMAVFEDDVVFSSDFKDIFPRAYSELREDWDVWHLHASRAAARPASERTVRVTGKLWGTHGYLICAKGCKRLLALPGVAHVDSWMSARLHDSGGQVYGVALPSTLVFQRGEDSDIPETAQLEFWREQRARFCR